MRGVSVRTLVGRGRLGALAVLATAVFAALVWPALTWPARKAALSVSPPSGVAEMVARVLPAVVSITIRGGERAGSSPAASSRGLGSGFIIDERGYIVTNYHVVEGAEQIKITLPDERAFSATVVGTDRFTDLALLKIQGDGLPTIPLRDGRPPVLGETVVAIGSPLWIEGGPTVTVGIVSGLGRSLEEPELPTLHGLIQTDAAINAGNSGGPLLDLGGRAVGINTAMIASAHGIGFAIPAGPAHAVISRLMTGAPVTRTSLGVFAVTLTPQLAFTTGLGMERGALVRKVAAPGPAAAAGIEPGDVIVAMGGTKVSDLHELHEVMFQRRPGERVPVTVWRNGRRLTVEAVLEADR